MERLEITVHGKVQGVWFRKFTHKKAKELGLHGYVTNQNNGTVFIEATGEKKELDIFIHWLENKGSPLSKVTSVAIIKLNTEKQFNSFEIKR
ncbi:MAG: acylphosphatase [Flavobacteriaceae bacterium]|nr:acylphosphatase [Flavobacteriaceae bacterium]